jgi:thiol:disulfide interchange protein
MRNIYQLATALLLAFAPLALADGFPAGSPAFSTSQSDVLKKAAKDGKPGIIIFSASWCGPCQENKAKVYPSAKVAPYHDKFAWAYLDVDDEANAKAIAKYGVEGIPHIEFVDKDGKSLGKMSGGSSPADFAKQLEKVLAATAKSSAAPKAEADSKEKPAAPAPKAKGAK